MLTAAFVFLWQPDLLRAFRRRQLAPQIFCQLLQLFVLGIQLDLGLPEIPWLCQATVEAAHQTLVGERHPGKGAGVAAQVAGLPHVVNTGPALIPIPLQQ